MKVAILAGGLGSRISEETDIKPKPMVEIGGRPILWHIMKHYGTYGYDDFVIALGYKGEVIKRYWVEHASLHGDVTVSMREGVVHRNGYANGGARSRRCAPCAPAPARTPRRCSSPPPGGCSPDLSSARAWRPRSGAPAGGRERHWR